ncbi:DNA-binding protein [Alsobacter soli]|uniref:DNA-binding protein n=2 Tax=Alsobacter soli TaxID=2109933 RepID=A0A2T1HQ72_9HYPH|nr:DNA-binding protein [Alsobacter soli]
MNRRVAHTIPQAVERGPFSRATLYRLIKAGKLPARKFGPKVVIVLEEDLQKLVQDLPPAREHAA